MGYSPWSRKESDTTECLCTARDAPLPPLRPSLGPRNVRDMWQPVTRSTVMSQEEQGGSSHGASE